MLGSAIRSSYFIAICFLFSLGIHSQGINIPSSSNEKSEFSKSGNSDKTFKKIDLSKLPFSEAKVDLTVNSESGGGIKMGCSGFMTDDGKKRVFTFEADGQVHQMTGEAFRQMLKEQGLSEEDITLIQEYLCQDDEDSEHVELDGNYKNKDHEKIKMLLKEVEIHRLLKERLADPERKRQDIREVEAIMKEHEEHLRKDRDKIDSGSTHSDHPSSG